MRLTFLSTDPTGQVWTHRLVYCACAINRLYTALSRAHHTDIKLVQEEPTWTC